MLQGLDTKQKLSAVFLAFLCLIVGVSVWTGLRFDSHKEKIAFSPQQLKRIEDCQSGDSDLLDVAESNIVCYPNSETKRDIVLLSTYPVTGAPLVRGIYEEATGVSSYTQYLEGGSYIMACDFQTGPWKLYCSKHPDKLKCANKSPPPKNSPYFVNSNYPVYEHMCDKLGYPLPRHEKVIHIVRNPIDNIEAWIHYEYGKVTAEAWTNPTVQKYIDEYYHWHQYWKDYQNNEPEIPTLWIRYEDFCLCMQPAILRILEFSHAISKKDKDTMATMLAKYPCKEAKEVGKGVSYYSDVQLEYIKTNFAFVLKQFGYADLMDEFIKHSKDPEDNKARAAFHDALWGDINYGSHPSDEYCAMLLGKEWDWSNGL